MSDAFETRLTRTAARLGWSDDAIAEILRHEEDLARDPIGTAKDLAAALDLDQSAQFELRILGTRKAPPRGAADGTQFELNPPSAGGPKPPPVPPSKRPTTPSRSTFPPTPVAPAREADRTVSGHTLREEIRLVHAEPAPERLRDLMVKLAAVGSTVGNAHRNGLVLRNLAPDNLLLGEAGEVVYADPRRIPTPAYCSPEQARDAHGALSPASDVFALGCILFECLTGSLLFAQVGKDATLKAIIDDDRRKLESPFQLPAELERILKRATAGAPGSRFADGTSFAAAIDQWLDGNASDAPSLDALSDHPERVAELRRSATLKRAESVVLLSRLTPGARIPDKQPAWSLVDDAAGLEAEADRLEREYRRALEGELARNPLDVEVRRHLADLLHQRHRDAELEDRPDAPALAEELAEVEPRRFASYLQGDGRLSLVTEPPGAEVDLYRYELKDRRLWPTFVRTLGKTPLTDIPLSMGSYVCIVRHPDCVDVRYPVLIRRRTHWHGRGPDHERARTPAEPRPVVLPAKSQLDERDIYVPAGWFRCGGPPEANAMPRTWTWCAGFVIRRDPVWLREYLEFLDALEKAGDPELDACLPRSPDGRPLVVSRNHSHHVLADALGQAPSLDWPVTHVPWTAATVYARWYAEKTGQPWRLPEDLEWEKAARGVDGRIYPWGNGLDPLFACYAPSHASLPHPVDANAYPADSSPYGVRGLAGNVRDWCRDGWQSRESIATGNAPPAITPSGPKVVRGGHFDMTGPGLVSWMRSRVDASTRSPRIGFRLARLFPG
ncbi:MAG: SUMF1/EgtB/PvdO family nonheme iron enzyme [Myxococcota bacterium]